jgi:ABC-type dipeptide/oligopeptide/nickel transport system ATPase component
LADAASFRDAPLLGPGARSFLGRGIGCIFQDPRASLAPHLRIGFQLEESLEVGQRATFENVAATPPRPFLLRISASPTPNDAYASWPP